MSCSFQFQYVAPFASAVCALKDFVTPSLVKLIWHDASGVVLQTDDILFGAGEPLKLGRWLLMKLPEGTMSSVGVPADPLFELATPLPVAFFLELLGSPLVLNELPDTTKAFFL
jgi:hypothetical protein